METEHSDQTETDYLLSIDGMKESIIEGMQTPINECDKAVEWEAD